MMNTTDTICRDLARAEKIAERLRDTERVDECLDAVMDDYISYSALADLAKNNEWTALVQAAQNQDSVEMGRLIYERLVTYLLEDD